MNPSQRTTPISRVAFLTTNSVSYYYYN